MTSGVYTTSLKKIILAVIWIASLWLALFSVASAEVIKSFEADYQIHDDSSVTVTETILYDFEGVNRHGIFRNIKDKHPQPASVWYKERYVDINLVSVSRDGNPEPYTLESYDGLSVRIGDANRTITGTHTYKIVYTLDGSISSYGNSYLSDGMLVEVPDTTEFYWNVTGNEWEVPIQETTATVWSKGASLDSTQYCYAGASGVNSVCDSKEIILSKLIGRYAVFKNGTLRPGQELTIAQAVNLLNPPVVLERINYFPIILLGGIVLLVIMGIWTYRWRTEYKPDQTIIPQYEPYQDFKPMFTGVLIDNKLDPRDISAGIVYLAQQGFLSIIQLETKVFGLFNMTDYEVTLIRSVSDVETNFQKKLLSLLFDKMGIGKVVRLSEIKNNTNRLRQNAKTLEKLKKAVVKDLVERGFLEQRITRGLLSGLWSGVLVFFFLLFDGLTPPLFGVIFVPCILILISLSLMSERRTRRGYEALHHLKGFKDFLSTTEKERYKFHNAPSLSPQQFMEYLPYAIAFGVEKEWAEVFKDIQIDAPDWYSSSTGSSFNAVAFSSGIGAFSSAFTGSTGSSGSSGGGSAGGGGGGGGGGSW